MHGGNQVVVLLTEAAGVKSRTVYFRADKRVFDPTDVIRTAGEFTEKHKLAGALMEEALEKARPDDKLKRSDCLMLFEDELRARRHWSLMRGGKLYTVVIADGGILHRDDMELTEQIGQRRMIADTCIAFHWPPRAVAMPLACSAAAILRSDVAPLDRISAMIGLTLAANLSAALRLAA